MAKHALIRQLGNADIRLLQVFITVCECKGLAASEFELNIGRSTISKYISDLETRMSLKLCHRGPSGFRLTDAGERVLDAATRLIGALDAFSNEVDEIHNELRGTLSLGLFDQSTTNPEAHIDSALRMFDQLAPDVDIVIAIEPPNVVEARVIEGTIDIGIVPFHRKSESLNYLSLYSETMTLYCGNGHPIIEKGDLQDLDISILKEFKYAGFGFNSPNMGAGEKLGLRRAARVQDEEALSLLIQSGVYLGFLADHVAEGFIRNNMVFPVAPNLTRYVSHFTAITRKSPQPGRKTQLMLDQLQRVHAANER